MDIKKQKSLDVLNLVGIILSLITAFFAFCSLNSLKLIIVLLILILLDYWVFVVLNLYLKHIPISIIKSVAEFISIFSGILAGILGCIYLNASYGILTIITSIIWFVIALITIILYCNYRKSNTHNNVVVENKSLNKDVKKTHYNEVCDKLKKLKELYDANILTEEEYQEKRSKLADLI